MKKIIAIFLSVVMLISSMMISAFAEDHELMSDVYVSATGAERAAGTKSAPTNSIVRALYAVKDGGTIHIDGTIVIPEGFSFNKNISIVGDNKASDILDLSAMPAGINLGGNTYFDGITLKSSDDLIIGANGNTLVVDENCATEGNIGIYGGGYNIAVTGDTNVTLLSGTYTEAYGGGYLKNVDGSTHLTVGGSANVFNSVNAGTATHQTRYNIFGAGFGGNVNGSTYVVLSGEANNATCSFTESDHSSGIHYVYGGGYNGEVRDSTNIRITENAKAHYVFGGMYASGTFGGSPETAGSNIIMDGGSVYGIYGAGSGCNQSSNANIIMLGGTVSQIIGGANASNLTGNVNIKLLGGTVARRVFGGCYNDWSLSWKSDYYVTGTITVTVADKANIALNQGDDNALSAHSRRSAVASEEKGVVVFTSQTAQDTYLSKFTKGTVAGGSAYDSYSVAALLAGDVNLDGVVDENDAKAIFRYVFDSTSYALLDSSLADANMDGKVTNADVLAILKTIKTD